MNYKQIYKTGLYWFTNDLRVEDNRALVHASETTNQLLCIYIVDPTWFKPNRYGNKSLGKHRWQFLYESLVDLQCSLSQLHQSLLIVYDDPQKAITNLIEQFQIDAIYRSQNSGFYENKCWQQLQEIHPGLFFHETATHTLFSTASLPIDLRDFQEGISFSRFRNNVDSGELDCTITTAKWLSPAPNNNRWALPSLPKHQYNATLKLFRGGSTQGKKHLCGYFSTRLPSDYKSVRNALDGWSNSTKFSPWLANGSLSVRQVLQAVRQYEKDVEANESTYWIYFELLWREYFQWLTYGNRAQLFLPGGIKNKKTLSTFYPGRYKCWCEGNTPYPLVNACMKQLNKTGYMSNRGRQIVASCLVNEMNLDWRYGAAYFEQQLIDYDVAVNWGNWQYLAGVGTDPRGKRHFDIQKQTNIYDGDGQFIQKWGGGVQEFTLDSVDAADWPIFPMKNKGDVH